MKCCKAVEEKIASFFESLGGIIAKHPWKVIIIVILMNGLLGVGMINLKADIDVSRVYTPTHSQAIKDESVVKKIFPDKSGFDFYSHQLFVPGKSATIIIKSNGGNILDKPFLGEVLRLDGFIRNVSCIKDDTTVTYTDVCARRSNSCVVAGDLFLHPEFELQAIGHSVAYPTFVFKSGDERTYSSLVAEANVRNGSLQSATHLKIQYFLRSDTIDHLLSAQLWEEELVNLLKKFASDKFDFAFAHDDSLSEELNANIGGDISLFSVTFVLMITYACLATYSVKHDCIGNRMFLGLAGVLAAGMSIVAAFGLVSACGMSFVSIVGNVPFLLIGIGVDDMFILLSGIADADYNGNTESRVGQMLKRSGVAITITSLTDILAFGVGATSSFKSVRNFCVYTGVAVIFCYLNQTFFFTACVALNEWRANSKRHFICCHKTKPKTEMTEKGCSKLRIFFCAGSLPKSRKDVEGLPEKGVRKYFTKFVLLWPVKIIVLILFSGYLVVSIWGAIDLKQGLIIKDLVAEDSYLYKYETWENVLFPSTIPVSLVLDKTYEYSNYDVQKNIMELLASLQTELFISNRSISWLEAYKSAKMFYRNSSESIFIQGLHLFLNQPQNQHFKNDVNFGENSISASRLYVFTTLIQNSQDKGKTMQIIREISSKSPLSVIAFAPAFLFWEQYIAILPQTLQTLGAGLAAVVVIMILFMPNAVLLFFVVFTMAMIMTGIIGFMQFWNLTLSSVTMIHLVMCIGFSVDFTAHICHAFMVADGSNRNERVTKAIIASGGPIFNGFMSSVVGILMLSMAKSYIFRSFFQVMLLVIVFGACHALFFLPVILSFVGPEREELNISWIIHAQNTNSCAANEIKRVVPISKSSMSNYSVTQSSFLELKHPFKIPRPRISY